MAVSDDRKAHARYSKVDRRLWNDRRGLSPIPPCGQGLWLYFLTTPYLGVLPGLIMGGEAMLAEHLGWSVEGFREAFAEVFAEGMARADWKARLVVLPKVVRLAVRRGSPESPNVVRGWKTQWLEVPDCALKDEYYRELKGLVEGLGEAFAKAFAEAFAKGNDKPSPNQDQEQEQKQISSLAGASDARAPASTRVTSAPTVSPEAPPASEPKPLAPPPDEVGLSDNEATVLSALRRWRALADLATSEVAQSVYGGATMAGRAMPAILRGIAEYGEQLGNERAAGSREVADCKALTRYMATAAQKIAREKASAERQSVKPTTALQRDNPNQPNWRQAPDHFKDQENEEVPWA